MSDALSVDDAAAAAVQVGPRASKESIEAKIREVHYIRPSLALNRSVSATDGLRTMTICLIEMQNGFIVTGESAPAAPENFNEDLGKQFAYENAFRKLWPHEGYLLRERLHLGEIEAIAKAAPVEAVAEEPQPEAPAEESEAEPEAQAPVDGGADADTLTEQAGDTTTDAPAETLGGGQGEDSVTAQADAGLTGNAQPEAPAPEAEAQPEAE